MDLCETRIGKCRAMLVGAPDGRAIGAARVSGKIVDVAVSARGKYHRVCCVRFNFSGDQIAGDDAARFAVDQDEAQHFGSRKHFDFARSHLPLERLIGSQEQLLSRLPARVEGA